MLSYFLKVLEAFNAYAAKNQMVAGAISLWTLGVVSYLCKDVPYRLWSLIKKFSTTTVTLSSHDDVFYSFLKWYESKGFSVRGRYVKISNGKYGDGEIMSSLGYGNHYFWHKKHLFILNMTKRENTVTDKDKDEISMVMLGRNHEIFKDMFQEIVEEGTSNKNIYIKKFTDGWWMKSSEQRPRSIDTICIKKSIKNQILKYIDNFLEREQWYLDNNIPYQMGILLYGPPGTGKTSLIKAISHYIGYQMHILSASSLVNIENAMFRLPEKSLIVIEDIDTDNALKERSVSAKKVNTKFGSGDCIEDTILDNIREQIIEFSFSNLSDVLNAIDGVQSNHGRILIMTTNHIEDLDAALLRPGRIDLQINLDYIDNEILRQFFDRFYPSFVLPENFEVVEGVSSALVQNLILENLNEPQKVLDALKKK